jgi:hypothetical protein
MKTRTPSIQESTHGYETWLAGEMPLVQEDLALKHQRMREGVFSFLRATYYRWAQRWPEVCGDLLRAPEVLAVGDLHVENFGTWRDAEGRLVWGINDFDEATPLPYTQDLVRLATSAHVAIAESKMALGTGEADEAILDGYRAALEHGGRPFVLAEHASALRNMAVARLRDPAAFWRRLDALPDFTGQVSSGAVKALSQNLPVPDLPRRLVHRVAGLGSLGRERFVAIAEWQGGKIAREAKALAPSAAAWAHGATGETKILYLSILERSLRCADPWVHVKRRWIVRRLAPDCSRIELAELGAEREEVRLLQAMGWETANIHLGSRSAHALLVDLAVREEGWLHRAAKHMLQEVEADWQAWRENPRPMPAEKIKLQAVEAGGEREGKGKAKAKKGAKTKDGKGKEKEKEKKASAGSEAAATPRAVDEVGTARAKGKEKAKAAAKSKAERAAKAGSKAKGEAKARGKAKSKAGSKAKQGPKAEASTQGKAGRQAKAGAQVKAGARGKAGTREKAAKRANAAKQEKDSSRAKSASPAKAGARSAASISAKGKTKVGAQAKRRTPGKAPAKAPAKAKRAQSGAENRAEAGKEIAAEAENRAAEQAAAPPKPVNDQTTAAPQAGAQEGSAPEQAAAPRERSAEQGTAAERTAAPAEPAGAPLQAGTDEGAAGTGPPAAKAGS